MLIFKEIGICEEMLMIFLHTISGAISLHVIGGWPKERLFKYSFIKKKVWLLQTRNSLYLC